MKIRSLLLIPVLLLAVPAFSQLQSREPPAPPPTLDLMQVPTDTDVREAGMLLEKAGRKRQTAFWVYLASGVVGGMAAAMDPETAGAPLALAGVGAVVGLGLNYSAAGNEKRAGIALQR